MNDGIAADLRRLLKLQEEETLLRQVLARVARLEAGGPVEEARQKLARLEAEAAAVASKLNEARVRASQREREAEGHHAERQRLENRMYSGEIVNVTEMDKLQAQITHLAAAAAAAEEEALVAMEETEQLTAAQAGLKTAVEEARETLAALEGKRRQQLAAAQAEAAAQKERRDEAAAAVLDETLLRRYERMLGRGGLGGLAIVPVRRGACGGCDVGLSMALLSQVKKFDALHTCENCGRGLVFIS